MKRSKYKIEYTEESYLAIKWWERKRIIYNIITILGGFLGILFRSEVPNVLRSYNPIFELAFLLFGANVFYTCAWGSEFLLNYYFKLRFWEDRIRLILFILGCFFSFCWIFFLTRDLL
jgi:hypothetical protein